MISNSETHDINEKIINVIKEKKPQSVQQLVTILEANLKQPADKILELVLDLQANGKINLDGRGLQSQSITDFVTGEGLWYLLTIAIGTITASMVFTIPNNFYPWIYLRNFFGAIFVLFLPGYAFIKALFPTSLASKTNSRELETIERMVLSIGLSITLISIVGLLLYYSPWGLDLPAIIISLFISTSILATVGIFRSANKINTA